MKQTLIWTALPNGIADGKARLSVMLSPRLEGSGADPDGKTPLSDYPDFANWPTTVKKIGFIAHVSGVPDPIKLKPKFNLNEPLWNWIFTPGVYVLDHKFTDLKDHKLRTIPLRETLNYMKNVYEDWAESGPGIPPSFDTVIGTGLRGVIVDLDQQSRDRTGKKVESMLKDAKVLPLGLSTQENFYQAHKFYNRYHNTDPDFKYDRPETHTFDFHEAVAMLADHPSLMRALGLVLDFVMPIPPDPTGEIWVETVWEPAIDTPKTPKMITHYWQDNDQFLPQWKDNGDLSQGFLDLTTVRDIFQPSEKSDYNLVQIDPDGSLLKLMDFSYGMKGFKVKKYPVGMDREITLPALRSGGLGLVRRGRALQIHQKLIDAEKKNKDLTKPHVTEEHFWAEDLLRGYRVDVKNKKFPDEPRSLCWRQGHYVFHKAGESLDLKPEEGYIKSSSATSQPDDPDLDGQLYLHESLFRWNGWSLCVERPNQVISPANIPETDPNTGRYENVMRPHSQPKGEVDLDPVLEAVPGSLPRLRFGSEYQLRVRAVDLAGNSLASDHKNWTKATEFYTYRRYEPLASPTLVLREDLSAGEGVERMVIRSNYDTPSVKVNERHVVPPKTSQEMAETHGMFDDYIGPGQDHKKGYNIALREAGNLSDKQIINLSTGLPEDLPDKNLIKQIEVTGNDGSPVTQTLIHGEEDLYLPYLPDPMAAGVTLRNIPRLTASWLPGLDKVHLPVLDPIDPYVLKIPFKTDWPDVNCFRIRLAERNGEMIGTSCSETFDLDGTHEAHWDETERLLTIYLAKAEKVVLRYSSFFQAGNEWLFAVWDWLKNKPDLLKLVQNGCLWMVTPYRKLELVHAVQQPLCEPRFDANAKTKKTSMGQTHATFTGNATLNAWSTEKVELQSDWTEWYDTDPEGPKQKAYKAVACECEVKYEEPNSINLAKKPHDLRQEFGDTRHRNVNYHLVATSRYREYFPPAGGVQLDYTRTGPSRLLNVDNSARPAAPKIQYIVPSFGWQTTKTANQITHIRVGGGLRVYIDRPWYSSGDDELLGVVLARQDKENPQPIPEEFVPYVTQRGRDPIWKSAIPENFLYLSDFRGWTKHQEGLTLDELPSTSLFVMHAMDSNVVKTGTKKATKKFFKSKLVDVVGYKPEFNEDRKLWFCDVQFNPNHLQAYYPFVRMALCRYQPYSIPNSDAFLSRVVMTDFMQLVPTRTLKVDYLPVENTVAIKLQLKGFAPHYTRKLFIEGVNIQTRTNPVTIRLEKHDDAIPGELGWKPEAETIVVSGLPDAQDQYLMTWSSVLGLPNKTWSQRKHYRLVIKEFEYFDADGQIAVVEGEYKVQDAQAGRVVYSDVINLADFE